MSVITFINRDRKENGQTFSVAAIATCMAIEHNYKILLISTDFDDRSMEECFYKKQNKGMFSNPFAKQGSMDISSGFEGLIRMFASNRAEPDIIKSYTKPILTDRLDLLLPPKTKDYKEYKNVSVYFSQIADVANHAYDMVLIDLSKDVPLENQKKVMDLSSLVVVSLIQNQNSISAFEMLKNQDEFYRKSNVALAVGKYNNDSKFTAKNIGRYLKEKNIPLVIPYNILFADNCSEGKIIYYFLSIQGLERTDGKDGYFLSELRKTVDKIDYLRQAYEYGLKN